MWVASFPGPSPPGEAWYTLFAHYIFCKKIRALLVRMQKIILTKNTELSLSSDDLTC